MSLKNEINKIIFKEDGVYFLIDNKDFDSKQKILDIIEFYNIDNINYLKIESQLNKNEKLIFLSNDFNKFIKDEKIEVTISNDCFYAKAKIYPPLNKGKLLEKEDIISALIKENVKYGIDFNEITEFLKTRNYKKEYIFAKGTLPEKSKDGYIDFFVDINQKINIPKILEDGSLDYKNLNLFESVKQNQPIAQKKEGTIGKYGIDIFGKEVLGELPLPPPELPLGKNTFISDDGNTLLAKLNGRVLYIDNKLNILPILDLPNGVNSTTGNINFPGHIIIKGVVLAGFTVEAEGNIEIRGSVEAANIISKGSISVTRGIHSKANIFAYKDVNAQFIEDADVFAKQNIISNYILQGNIKCCGNLILFGNKSKLIGSKVIVGKDAFIKCIGSNMSNNTEISIGISPEILEKYEYLSQKIDSYYKKYSELEKIVKLLSKQDFDKLSIEKKELFEHSLKEKLKIKNLLSNLKEELSIITPFFTKRIGNLKIYSTAYAGTKIIANDAILFIKNDLKRCSIRNVDGKVMILNE